MLGAGGGAEAKDGDGTVQAGEGGSQVEEDKENIEKTIK